MTMTHDHASLRARAGEPEAVDDIVQSPFEKLEQDLTGDAALALSALEVKAKLLLEQAVDSLHFLLFAKLKTVSLNPGPTAFALLSRCKIALLYGAFLGKATVTFQEELHPFPPTLPAD
jgi:hypothetical protein